VIWIEEKIKEGSQVPNYSLLNNQRTVDDFLSEINGTDPLKNQNKASNSELTTLKNKEKEGLKALIKMRAKRNS
jgi:hypothetical protein